MDYHDDYPDRREINKWMAETSDHKEGRMILSCVLSAAILAAVFWMTGWAAGFILLSQEYRVLSLVLAAPIIVVIFTAWLLLSFFIQERL